MIWLLYACGALALALQFLPWSPWIVASVIFAAVAGSVWTRRHLPPRPSLHPIDAATLLVLTGYALYATIAGPWEWDAWAIWMLKARIFFERGGIDWQFLQAEGNAFAHPDYPLLVPATLAAPAIVTGIWSERWLGLVGVAILVAAVAVVRRWTALIHSPAMSASMALVVAGLGASRYVGTAETPLMAFSAAALALLHTGQPAHAAICLGLAAITKNEGMALMFAVAAALIVTRRWRDLLRLWPAAIMVAPWQMQRALYGIPSDVLQGSAVHIDRAGEIVRLLVTGIDRPLLWIAVTVAAVAAWKNERTLFTVVLIQLAVCVAVYFTTPHDVVWHITTSWDRVSHQIVLLAALAALAGLAQVRGAVSRGEPVRDA